jgi:uncharacterized protein YpiB (UPF0302 family)
MQGKSPLLIFLKKRIKTMDETKLNEYRLSWWKKVNLLLKYEKRLTENELKWVDIFREGLCRKNELSRKQSKTLNDIYQRFVNNNG